MAVLREIDLKMDWSFVLRLEQLNDGSSDLVVELMQLFLDLTPARLEALGRALTAGDLKERFYQAHTLKSGCANLGLVAMTEFCRRLEGGLPAAEAEEIYALLVRHWEVAKVVFAEAIDKRRKRLKTA